MKTIYTAIVLVAALIISPLSFAETTTTFNFHNQSNVRVQCAGELQGQDIATIFSIPENGMTALPITILKLDPSKKTTFTFRCSVGNSAITTGSVTWYGGGINLFCTCYKYGASCQYTCQFNQPQKSFTFSKSK